MRAARAWAMRALLSVGALGLGACGVLVAPELAVAQERDAARVEENILRYRTILEKTPTEGFVFKQYLKALGLGQRLDKEIEHYRTKFASERKAAYALITGHLLKAAKRYDEALEAYESALGVDPKNVDAHLGRGLCLQALKRHGDAQQAFEKALGLETDKTKKETLLRKLADIAFNQLDWEAADRYYAQMIQLQPKADYLRKEYADILIRYKRYDKALEQYKALERQAGRNVAERVEAMSLIGDVYVLMERYDDALAIWDKVLAQVSGDSFVRRQINERVVAVYRIRNDLAGLVKQYEKQWRSPSYEQAMIMAGLYDELGDDAKALAMYQTAVKRDSSSSDARLRVIRILERRGDDAAVLSAYQDLIRVEPKQASYQFELAQRYQRKGDERAAMGVASKIARAFSKDIVVMTNLAELYLGWGARDKALGIYKSLVRTDPSNPDHLIALGEFYWQDGKRDAALQEWRKIPAVMPVKAEGHATLAQVYADHSMPDEAVAQYEKALALDPTNEALYRGLAQVFERSRRLDKAVAAWETLLAKTDRDFLRREARSRIIQILYRQNTLRPKIAAWQTAFDTKADREAGYFLGEAFLVLKDYRSAEATFKKLLAQNEGDTQALLSLHKLYNQTGDHAENIAALEKLASLDPLRAREYYHRIAELSLKLYEDDQAVRFASMAVEANPSDANAHARLGAIYRQMQDLQRAVAEYRTALELDPMAYRYYFDLAEIFLALDQIRDAEKLYRDLVGASRDDSMILRAGRKSIDINDSLGTLDLLEGVLVPKLSGNRPKPAYGRLLIELYDRMTRSLVAAAEHGRRDDKAAAEKDLQTISRRALGPLLQALQSEDTSLKLMAIRILGSMRDPNAAVPLARLIEDSNREVQLQAALAVGKLGDGRAAKPMLKALGSNDQTLRELAVWSLGRMRAKEARGALERALKDDPFWTIRALSAIALGRIGDPASAKALSERLASATGRDARKEVRVASAWGLGALGSAQGLDALKQTLAQDGDSQVRRMAAWALGSLAPRDDKALRALVEAYWTGDPQVREVAGKSLLRLGDARPEGAPPAYAVWEEGLGFYNPNGSFNVGFFLDTLLSDELLAQGADGTAALIRGEAAITDLLGRQLQQADPELQVRLLYDLDQADTTLSLGALTWTLPEDPKQRAQVDAALGRIGKGLVDKLVPLLGAERPVVRGHAAGILGKIGDPRATDPLIKLLSDDHKDVRRKAAQALGGIGDPRATDPLLGRLSDDYWAARAHAAVALGRLQAKPAVDPLIKALDDSFPWVQASAAEGLGLLGDARAVPALVKRLDAAPGPVKVEILRALARLKTPEATQALERYRDDPDPRIRKAIGM